MGQKIISVFGATGSQGGSVARTLIQDGTYAVRAIVRNPQSSAAKDLSALGAEITQADLNDYNSLEKALAGSSAIYAVTNFFEPFMTLSAEEAIEFEVQQGINVAKAAAATSTLEHFIWSTLPNSRKISSGKNVIPHFDGKNRIDDFIKGNKELFDKTTFLWVTYYSANFKWPMFTPFPAATSGPNKYLQIQATPAFVPVKSVGDVDVNVGLFVKAILAQPEKTLPGRFVLANVEDFTAGELLQTWAKAQGKEASFVQVDKETYYGLWPKWAEEMDAMMSFWHAAGDKSWSGEEGILTKDDLGITGLVNTANGFSKMDLWN